MKIAVYSGVIPSTTFIENLIRGLADAGHEVYLFGRQQGPVNYSNNTIKIFATPTSRAGLSLFLIKESLILFFTKTKRFLHAVKFLKQGKSFGSFLRRAGLLFPMLRHEPDILHIQWAKTIQQNPEMLELLKSRIVLSLRGAHINYSPMADKKLAGAYRKYFPRISGFHAVSEAISREAGKYGAERAKTKVIYSPVPETVLKEFAKKNDSATPLRIISIGRFHWKKGYNYALDAMGILRDKGIEFTYTIVAQGDTPAEVLYHIADLKLEDHIKLINGLRHEEVIKLVKEQNIFLLPSVEEGIANVVLEAMALGTSVISTDCGGMEEIIQSGVNGIIVPIRDANAIADSIEYLLKNNLSVSMADAARETIVRGHSVPQQMRKFEELYREVLARA